MRKIHILRLPKMGYPVRLAFLLFTLLLLRTAPSYSQTGLITSITTTTGHSYTVGELITGTTIYSDRAYLATDVPAFLTNAPFIKTPNDDKANKATTSPTFVLTQSATVYIAYDPRATALPAWLSSWQKLASQVGVNDPNISGLTLYSKVFAAGKVTLGGNLATPAAGALNMYLIIAVAQNQYNLTVTTSGSGSVSKNPDQANYAAGTSVSLTPTPAAGQQFTGWSGDASGTTVPLTIIMNANKSVTATFAPIPPQFSVNITLSGDGSVSKNPNQATYTSGTDVTLTATPSAGQQFAGWSGDTNSTVNPLTITVTGNKNITASFTPTSSALITNITATSGRSYTLGSLVTGTTVYTDRAYQATGIPAFLSNAPLIKTPNDDKASKATSLLSFTLTQNATVYVVYDPRQTAIPAWLSTWQKLASQVGINDPNIGGLLLYSKAFSAGKVTLGGNLATPAAGALTNYFVAALAQAPLFNLTLTTSGNGTVAKDPTQATYAGGTGVTLTATPAAGQQFVGWSGDATGSVNPLTVLMEANKLITATFAPISTQYNLTITISGSGTVTKNPNQATYASGSSVTLTATPAAGQQFTGWSGAVTSTANPLTIIMSADKSVTATFAPAQYNLSVTTSGNGTVSKNPDQLTYTSGTTVNVTATPAAGQQFTGWSGDTSATTNPLTLVMNANKSVIATFSAVTAGPSITAFPLAIYDNDVTGGATGANRSITLKNTGQGVLSLSGISLTGTNSNQFVLTGLPTFPANITAGDSISFSTAFNPTSTGIKVAFVTINSNDPLNASTSVSLRGLGTAGLGGSNEPSLQNILNLYEIQATVGDDNVATGIIHSNTTTQKAALLGEEISIQQFQKAGAGNVTITPLDVFGPTFNSTVVGFGWYRSGNAASKSELFSVSNNPLSNGQTVNVKYSGTLSFDPSSDKFGFYSRWPYFNNRHLYSEDSLNTFAGAAPHHVRIYLYKKNGIIVPDSYVVAFEEDTAKLDYQDLVFVVSNVKKFSVPTEVTILPAADAYVRNGTFSSTNFGADTSLVVKSTSSANAARYSYLKFSLDAISGATKVRSAKVRLYGSNKDNATNVNATLFGLNNDSWTEPGINLNNAPLPATVALSTTIINNINDYYEFDVTDFVKAELAGDKVVGIFVKDTTNKNATLVFNSKENSKNGPQLVIDTSSSISYASLFVENTDGYPSNEHVVFSRIQVPWTRDSIYNANHDSVKIRLHNYGINPLIISNFKVSVDSLWKIDKLNGLTYNASTQLPAVVSSGGVLDLMVKFTANKVGNQATRVKLLHETLTITSNDDKYPNKKVYLDGIWQYAGEGDHEPYSHEIINIFGYKSQTGYTAEDPDLGDTTKLKGDEIKSGYFLRADSVLPVTAKQISAYHGCCQAKEHFKWFEKGTKVYNDLFSHIGLDGQTLLPRKSTNGSAAGGTFTPSKTPFGIQIADGNTTDPSVNTGKKLGVRVYKALDEAGNIIPNAYLFAGDYLGTAVTNYDYNDNLYYVTNIKPYVGTAYYSTLGATPSALDFNERLLQTTDSLLVNISNEGKTYADGSQDPSLVISSVVITGENAAEFSAQMPLNATLLPQQATTVKVKFSPLTQGLKIADMLIYYNNAQSPKRVPLYGIAKAAGVTVSANYRVNSGASVATTFNGKTWAADNQYAFDNLESYKNPAVKQIAATEEDFLYVDEQSSNGDKKPFRYQFPVANGTYYVRLHFAEIYWGAPGLGLAGGAGSRVFSVKLENQYRLANYDLIQEVSGATAVVKNFVVTVTDGSLNIDFSATVNRPLVSAVEVYSFSSTEARPAMVAKAQTVQNTGALTSISKPGINTYEISAPRVYPNPLFNRNFNIQFPGKYQGIYTMQLADILGREYNLGKTTLNGAGSNLKVDISRFSLKPGVYFLKINSNTNKSDVIKLLIN